MRQVHQRRTLVVCVIEQNRLAAEYLLQLLTKDPAVQPLLLEDFPGRAVRPVEPIFLLDNCALPLPVTECLRRLQPRYPMAKYLVLDKEQSLEETVRMLWSGVHGFLEHREVAQGLLEAVRTVSKGQVWASPEVLQVYVRFTAAANRRRSPNPETMTLRETQIIELVKRRLSNREVAATLRIQESTVKFHLSNIFAKLRLTNRHELVRKDEARGGWAEILT